MALVFALTRRFQQNFRRKSKIYELFHLKNKCFSTKKIPYIIIKEEGRLRRVIAKKFSQYFLDKRINFLKRWKNTAFEEKSKKFFWVLFGLFTTSSKGQNTPKNGQKTSKNFFQFFLENSIFSSFRHFLRLSKNFL